MKTAAFTPLHSPSVSAGPLSLLALLPWLFYVVFAPVYLFPSGLPQVSDIVLMLGVLPVLALRFMNFRGGIPALHMVGGLFAVYTVAINTINFAFYPDVRFLLTAAIYVFNFFVMAFVVMVFRADPVRVPKLTYYAYVLSVALQLIAVLFLAQKGWRATGTFNNPNQFAYWGILTSVVLVFLKRGQKFSPLDYAVFAAITYLESRALSKAGMITYLAFWSIILFTPQVSHRVRALIGALIMCFAIYFGFSADNLRYDVAQVEGLGAVARLENIGQENDDSAEARGYSRLFDFPEYTIMGAGEGAFWRFDNVHVRELHSGLATIVFSYGIFGSALFLLLLYTLFRHQPWYYTALLGVIVMFGLTHQNFRTSDFWVFLGISYASMYYERARTAVRA